MEIRLNLATASLKDAEHAIFIIGAYYGLTQSAVSDVRVLVPSQDLTLSGGELARAPVEDDPAQVFAGNGGAPTVPALAGAPALPPVPPSAPTAAGPVGLPPAPTPAPVASAPPVGVDVDGTGLPWDGRIHALSGDGTHPKNADGTWRKKRGLNDGVLVARIEAELRAVMAAGGAPAAAPIAPPLPPTPPALAVPPASPTVPPAAPSLAAPPVAPSAAAAPPVDPTTFEQLMPRVTDAVVKGVVPQTALPEAVQAYGLPQVPMLANRPDLVPAVWAYLKSLYPAMQ